MWEMPHESGKGAVVLLPVGKQKPRSWVVVTRQGLIDMRWKSSVIPVDHYNSEQGDKTDKNPCSMVDKG